MLRHTNRPAPAWMAQCFGPLLLFVGVFGVCAILLSGSLTLSSGAGLMVGLFLAIVGGSTTLDQVRKR